MPKTLDVTVPNLTGKLAIVTGASDGIGFHIADQLARSGADVVMPVRNVAKGEAAAQRIREGHPGAIVEVRELDLASLASTHAFGSTLLRAARPIDILINNAGVMTPPTLQTTEDGMELQFQTNHLGHFALVTQVLPLLKAGNARVVSQVSIVVKGGAVNWDDINWTTGYDPGAAYSSSKIAIGLLGMELHYRSLAEEWGIESVIAHPGVAPTNLLAAQPNMGRADETRSHKVIRTLSRWGIVMGTAQSAAHPAIYAATSPRAEGGRMYGPSGFQQFGGPPAEQVLYPALQSPLDASRMWALSERLVANWSRPPAT